MGYNHEDVDCDMETISALLALCKGNPPVTDGFPSQRGSMQNFDFFCYYFEQAVEHTVKHLVIWVTNNVHLMSL